MTNPNLLRPGLTAIVAVLALSSTPLLAQEVVAPAATTPQTVPTPAPESAPVVTTSTTTETIMSPDPLAPAAMAAKPAAKTTVTKRTTTTSRTAAPRVTATRTAAPTVAALATAPVAVAAPIEAAPAPLTPLTPPPVTTAPVAPTVAPATMSDETLPIAGAAGLGLLALAGAGFAMRRRKRRHEEALEAAEWQEPVDDRTPIAPDLAPEPAPMPLRAAQPVTAPTPAFAWTPSRPVAAMAAATGSVTPDSSHFDAAMGGPTPDNPSLSLKRRLKRAAFFEQRDRQVAEGIAKPVSPMAGLPPAMAGEAPPVRDTRAKPVTMSYGGYRFQPT